MKRIVTIVVCLFLIPPCFGEKEPSPDNFSSRRKFKKQRKTRRQIRDRRGASVRSQSQSRRPRRPKPRDSFAVGPSVRMGAPHTVGVGIYAQLSKTVRWETLFSPVTIPVTISNVKLRVSNIETRVQIHPFQGALYFGLGGGYHQGIGEQTQRVRELGNIVELNAKAKVSAFYVVPHVGWAWAIAPKASLGIELGWYFPFNVNTQLETEGNDALSSVVAEIAPFTAQYRKLEENVVKKGSDWGSRPLPYVTLFRFVYLF